MYVHRRMDSIIAASSQPHPDQPPLSFEAPYAQGIVAQYVICVRKFFITFWRNPECAPALQASRCWMSVLAMALLSSRAAMPLWAKLSLFLRQAVRPECAAGWQVQPDPLLLQHCGGALFR